MDRFFTGTAALFRVVIDNAAGNLASFSVPSISYEIPMFIIGAFLLLPVVFRVVLARLGKTDVVVANGVVS